MPWSIVYSIVHTDCVDFQFTQNIYCCYNLVVVEQLYPKSWGYLVFIALIYKKRKKSFIRHEFSFNTFFFFLYINLVYIEECTKRLIFSQHCHFSNPQKIFYQNIQFDKLEPVSILLHTCIPLSWIKTKLSWAGNQTTQVKNTIFGLIWCVLKTFSWNDIITGFKKILSHHL